MRDINNNDDGKSFGSSKVRVQDSAHLKGKYDGDQYADWSTGGRGTHNPLAVNKKGFGFGTDACPVGNHEPMSTPQGAYRGGRAKKRISY